MDLNKILGTSFDNMYGDNLREAKRVAKLLQHKVSMDIAWPNIHEYPVMGIGFGSSYPELTEKMCKNVYENIDTAKWAEARKFGLDIPKEPEIVTFEE